MIDTSQATKTLECRTRGDARRSTRADYPRARAGAGAPSGALARLSGYSARHVCREFVHHFGLTPARFQRKVRIELACRLLRSNAGLSIGEVADRCDYGSYPQFAREFRALTGASPRAWRSGRA